jgi:hypothetical protein
MQPLAQTLARESQKNPSEAPEPTPSTSSSAEVLDPDLARLTALWPDLPEAGRKLLVTTAETLAGQLPRPGKRNG